MIQREYSKNGEDYREIIYEDAAEIRAQPITNGNNQAIWDSDVIGHSDSKSWFGIKGGAEGVFKACEKNWTPGYNKVHKTFEELPELKLESVRRKMRWAEFGNEVDIHKVLSGNLSRSWRECKRRSRVGRKKILLVCDVGGHCGRTDEEMFWTGAVTALLAEALVNSGQIVSVVVSGQTQKWGVGVPVLRWACTVKPFGAHMAPEALVAYTALSGFFRTYGFRVKLTQPEDCYHNLGYPMHVEEGFDYYNQANVQQVIVPKVWDLNSAKNAVNKLVGELYGTSAKAA